MTKINFFRLVELKYKLIEKETISFTNKISLWCQLPYPNHKQGCPNYNKNDLCPPNSENRKDLLDKFDFFYLVFIDFNFKKYRELRKIDHPKWSEKQIKNLLYWQQSITKILINYLIFLYLENTQISDKNFFILGSGSGKLWRNLFSFQKQIYSMEASGINVMKTLKDNEIDFEIKPENKILIVSLICCNSKLIFPRKKKEPQLTLDKFY